MIENKNRIHMKCQGNSIFSTQNRRYFSSFSSFEIFTYLIQTPIKLVLNWVYSLFQRPILKKRLEKLEKLEEHEKLENTPILHTTGKVNITPNTVLINTYRPYRNKSLHRVGHSQSFGSKYSTWQHQRNLIYTINELFSNTLSKWKAKRFHIQTIPNQWIAKKIKTQNSYILNFFENSQIAYNPSVVLVL
ncbi:hypothetical protein JT359_17025 [Candidatus Poribacteria bacterium]|nr:hypothetical protein [Candidatus Poribacteria bacterium]